jgi:hypothetical protein
MFLIAPSIDVKQVHFGPKLLGVLDIVWVKKSIRFLRIVFAHVRVFDEIAQANARLGTKNACENGESKTEQALFNFWGISYSQNPGYFAKKM